MRSAPSLGPEVATTSAFSRPPSFGDGLVKRVMKQNHQLSCACVIIHPLICVSPPPAALSSSSDALKILKVVLRSSSDPATPPPPLLLHLPSFLVTGCLKRRRRWRGALRSLDISSVGDGGRALLSGGCGDLYRAAFEVLNTPRRDSRRRRRRAVRSGC